MLMRFTVFYISHQSEQKLFSTCSSLKPGNNSIVFRDILDNSRSSVKMLNILRSAPESRDHTKPLQSSGSVLSLSGTLPDYLYQHYISFGNQVYTATLYKEVARDPSIYFVVIGLRNKRNPDMRKLLKEKHRYIGVLITDKK